VQSQKRHVGHLHHLEADTGDITHGESVTCVKPAYLNEVQAAVIGDERGDLLAVLDQLDPDALPDGRVGLLGFNTTVNTTNRVSHSRSTEGVGLQSGAQMGLLVLFIMPLLLAAVVPGNVHIKTKDDHLSILIFLTAFIK
uniref:Uncharacterized protein n=1 Tax=Cyprinus carpio carpio TaxID=630221 RepID=A0A9J7YUC0_CYPCA